MARRVLMPGYTRVPGSNGGRFLTPDGDVISRRQYDNRRVQQYGWRNIKEFQTQRKNPQFLRWYGAYRKKHPEIPSKAETFIRGQEAPKSPESNFGTLYAAAMNDRDGRGRRFASGKVRGPMHDLLVAAGLRDTHAQWAVGETPAA